MAWPWWIAIGVFVWLALATLYMLSDLDNDEPGVW